VHRVIVLRRAAIVSLVTLIACGLTACTSLNLPSSFGRGQSPLTVSDALGATDPTRDASLRLVITGLDDDSAGRTSRALASYQRAVRVDPTNPFAYLALARHHLEADSAASTAEASAFLDQARSLFESQQQLGPSIDVWGIGLRAWVDRLESRDEQADSRFDAARALSVEIWRDERLSAAELR
jgi:tetratricopeptide (TPR) repeat protein